MRCSTHSERAIAAGSPVPRDHRVDLIEDERRGLGTITHHRVALHQHPLGNARRRHRPATHGGVGDQSLDTAPGEKKGRPRRVGGGSLGEVVGHRIDLGVGRVGLIEGREESGEANHSWSDPASPSQAVRIVPVS